MCAPFCRNLRFLQFLQKFKISAEICRNLRFLQKVPPPTRGLSEDLSLRLRRLFACRRKLKPSLAVRTTHYLKDAAVLCWGKGLGGPSPRPPPRT